MFDDCYFVVNVDELINNYYLIEDEMIDKQILFDCLCYYNKCDDNKPNQEYRKAPILLSPSESQG